MSALDQAVDSTIAKARELAAFDKRVADGDVPPELTDSRRAKLVAAVREADAKAFEVAQSGFRLRELEASRLRAKAEADVDPTTRLADLTEAASLKDGRLSGDDLLARAHAMLIAEQPARAKLFFDAGVAKRGRDAGVGRDIDAALDKSHPLRKQAADMEAAVAQEAAEFHANRMRILAASIGVTEGGSPGQGTRSQRASANVYAKTSAYIAAVDRGETFSAPVGDGSNPEEGAK